MALATSGWAQLRQQIRAAESQTETSFHQYSQFVSTNNSALPSDEESKVESHIRDRLSQRESLIAQLGELLESESTLTASALKQNNLVRHREVLVDHQRELQKIRKAIIDARNRANLMSNVRSDINAYHSANPVQAEADYMLQERSRIDSSNRMAEGVLSQAYAINDQFHSQRETLASINRRITSAASQLPGMNSLMNRISSKKWRDAIILAVTIAFCFLMLLYFR